MARRRKPEPTLAERACYWVTQLHIARAANADARDITRKLDKLAVEILKEEDNDRRRVYGLAGATA